LVDAMRSPARALLMSALLVLLLGGAVTAHGDSPVAKHVRVRHALRHATGHAAPLGTFTFVGGGDIALTGSAEPSVLAGIRGYLHGADLAVGNLEGTLTTNGSPKCTSGAASGCFTFRGSPAWASTLRGAGFNVLNVANNHALDFGAEGQRDTLGALERAGLLEQGLPGQVLNVSLRSIRIALIGCAPYPWAQSLLDVAGTARLVRDAARHADVVIVYMHAGAEGSDADHVVGADETYLGERRGNSRAFAHTMIRAGADLVFGSGPHVVRGVEWYRHRLIAYSLGNLAGTHTLSTAGILGTSALLRATFDARGRVHAASIVPLTLGGGGTPIRDSARTAVARIRDLSRADFGPAAIRISATGRLAPPNARQF
jgi:Bacterial capsule synthesis protein PGA_cap